MSHAANGSSCLGLISRKKDVLHGVCTLSELGKVSYEELVHTLS